MAAQGVTKTATDKDSAEVTESLEKKLEKVAQICKVILKKGVVDWSRFKRKAKEIDITIRKFHKDNDHITQDYNEHRISAENFFKQVAEQVARLEMADIHCFNFLAVYVTKKLYPSLDVDFFRYIDPKDRSQPSGLLVKDENETRVFDPYQVGRNKRVSSRVKNLAIKITCFIQLQKNAEVEPSEFLDQKIRDALAEIERKAKPVEQNTVEDQKMPVVEQKQVVQRSIGDIKSLLDTKFKNFNSQQKWEYDREKHVFIYYVNGSAAKEIKEYFSSAGFDVQIGDKDARKRFPILLKKEDKKLSEERQAVLNSLYDQINILNAFLPKKTQAIKKASEADQALPKAKAEEKEKRVVDVTPLIREIREEDYPKLETEHYRREVERQVFQGFWGYLPSRIDNGVCVMHKWGFELETEGLELPPISYEDDEGQVQMLANRI